MGDTSTSAAGAPGRPPRSSSMPSSSTGYGGRAPTAPNPSSRLRRSQTDADAARVSAAQPLTANKSTSMMQRLRGVLSGKSPAAEGATEPSSDSGTKLVHVDVGIRPSFYWNKAILSEEERMLAVLSAKSLKSDSQDEVQVVRGFAGRSDWTFVGVFDGHGPEGRAAAKFACKYVQHSLQKDRHMLSTDPKKKQKALKRSCYTCQKKMGDYEQAGFDAYFSGTTAVFGLLEGSVLHIANCGDSRAVVARANNSNGVIGTPLTNDAKPEDATEAKRITRKGGEVSQMCNHIGDAIGPFRVYKKGAEYPGLAMSRSLGDITAHQVGVIAKPERVSYTLKPEDQFVVFASDGIWQVMGDQEVVEFVHMYMNARDDTHNCADALTLHAQDVWKATMEEVIVDDIGVAILHLKDLPPVRVKRALHHSNKAAETNDGANQMYRKWERMPHLDPGLVANKMHFNYLQDEAVQEAVQKAQEKARQQSLENRAGGSGREILKNALGSEGADAEVDSMVAGATSDVDSIKLGPDSAGPSPSPGPDNVMDVSDQEQAGDSKKEQKRVSLANEGRNRTNFFSAEQLERLSAMEDCVLPIALDAAHSQESYGSGMGVRRKSARSRKSTDQQEQSSMIRKLAKSFTSMGAGKSAREVTSRSSSGSHKASQKARAAKIKQAQQQREQAQAAVVTLKVPAANSSHYLSSAAAEHINQWLIKSKDWLFSSPDEDVLELSNSDTSEGSSKSWEKSKGDPLNSLNLATHDRLIRERMAGR